MDSSFTQKVKLPRCLKAKLYSLQLRTRYCCFILLALSLVIYGDPLITHQGIRLVQQRLPSIDHEILKATLRRKIKCPPTLWLIDQIIDSSNRQEPVNQYFPGDDLLTPIQRRKGLPIGNLTSQFFGNLMLSDFDHFIKEQLKVKHYLRYVDDFAAFSDDRELLISLQPTIEAYLAKIRLKLHPIKNQLFETQQGANFVGFRILPDRVRVRSDNLRRAKQRFRKLQHQYRVGQLPLNQLIMKIQGWEAHLKHGDTYRLRKQILSQLIFTTHQESVNRSCKP